MANIRIAPITTKKKKQDEIRIAPILTENQKRQQAMSQSKVMTPAPSPQVTMTQNNINNQISKNIVNGGLQNDIHNITLQQVGRTSLDKNIDLSGKSVNGKTTSATKEGLERTQNSLMSDEELRKKRDDLRKQLRNYNREEKIKWWDSDKGVGTNVKNVLYKTFAENNNNKYVEDKNYDYLLKRKNMAEEELENRFVERESQNMSSLDKLTYTISGNTEKGLKGINSTIYKLTGQDVPIERDSINERLSAEARNQSSGLEGVGLDVLGSMSRMLPQMVVGGVTNSEIASLSVGFANYGGDAYNEAKKMGATEEQATKYGLTIGSLEMGLEKLLGGMEGIYGKSALGKTTNKIMSKVVSNPTLRQILSNAYGEFTEEYLQEFLEPIVKNVVLEEDNGADFWNSENLGEGIKRLSSQLFNGQNLYAGTLGAISSSSMSIPSAISQNINTKNEVKNIKETINSQNIDQNIVSLLNKGYDFETSVDIVNKALSEKGMQQIDKKSLMESVKQSEKVQNSPVEQQNINNNINNQAGENVQNSMPKIENNTQEKYSNVKPPMVIKYQATDNERINSFRQSAVKEGMINSQKTTNTMNVIEKVISDKNYNVKFDRNITNLDGKSVDGKININKNGEVEIALNPKSDRAVEFLLTHEITHAIETKELRGIILDYAKKNPEFNSALKDLQMTYGTTNVSDEVIADISGQILGNQEFINSLSMQNTEQSRGIIQNIYHSIQRLLNKLTTKGRYRNFVEDLETKWREAYRLATNEVAVNNLKSDSKYAIANTKLDNSSFSLKEQVEIARKEFMDSKEKYGFDEKTKELQKKYNKLLTKLNQTENPVQKDTRPQIEKDVDGIVRDLLRTMEQDIIDNQFIDESIEETKYYKDNYIDETDEDILEELGIDQDEAERRNRELNDEIYDKLMNKLKDEGISIRYDKNGNAIYDRQELAIKGYNELLDYLDDKNINYEVSRSSEAGYVPSIYIKNSDGEVILRIANHKNHNLSDYDIQVDEKYNKLFSDKEYANWKEEIVPKIEENFEKFEWYNEDNQKYSQKSSTWQEHLENNYKATGTRTYFDEITNKKIAPINHNATTNQNKIKPPIAKEYQKNTIEEKKSNHEDVIKAQAEEIANQLNSGKSLNTKERRWIETSTESEILKDKIFKDDLDVNKINYEVKSNKKSINEANNKLDLLGYDGSINYVKNLIADGRIPTASDVALAQRTLQEASKKRDIEVVKDLVMDVAILGTELGQATQALSIINKLTPEGQLKLYSKIVHRAKLMGDKSFQDVEITPEMVEMILNAYDKNGNYDQNDLNNRVEQFKQKVADQLKTSVEEKIDAWRYLSMLGNPKTHIRNIISNVAMKCTIAYKNALARTIETFAPINTRTKTWKKSSPEIKQYAKDIAVEMKDVITGESKYGEKAYLESKKRVFKLAPLETISNFNSNALEIEDWFFSKRAFINTFQEYLTANGINTMEDIKNNPDIVEKGKTYAVEQAEIATFRQYSKLASAINKIERNNKVAKYVIKATVPFKKTPINVAKAGVKYSPLGLIKNVTYDIYQVKKGNINASQFIDNLSQGLSGTSLTILGYALAKAGILTGANGDDKDDKYDSYLGKQGYSIKIGNKYYSLSWLSPTAMPMFVGANVYEQLEENKGWDMNILSESLAKTLDPLNEMSFISSLTDALNSYGSGNDKIKGMGESVVQSYIGQFFPTLFSQFASVGDDTKRSTKASSNSSYKFGEQTVRSIMYKIPGLRNKLEPSTDIWGKEIKQNENILMRALESFILPYSAKEYKSSNIDKEIKKVYNDVGNTDVIPGFPQSYVKYNKEQYRMSAKEYTKYKKTYGTSANTMLNILMNTSNYKNSTGKRKTRMIKKVYDYSREISKEEFLSNRKIDYDKKKFKYNKNDYKKIVNYITSSTQYKDDD